MAKVKCNAIGLHSNATNIKRYKNGRVHGCATDSAVGRGTTNDNGVEIQAGPGLTQAVSSLPRMQYLRKLAAERRRIKKELARRGETLNHPDKCPVCGNNTVVKGRSTGHPLPGQCRKLQDAKKLLRCKTGKKGKARNRKYTPLVV